MLTHSTEIPLPAGARQVQEFQFGLPLLKSFTGNASGLLLPSGENWKMKKLVIAGTVVFLTLSLWAFAVFQPASNQIWKPFSLKRANEAIESGVTLCMCLTTESTIGTKIVSPKISDEVFKKLSGKRVEFMEIRLDDFFDIPDDFVRKYLRRTMPSVSILSSSGGVYCLSGEYSDADFERLLLLVCDSRAN